MGGGLSFPHLRTGVRLINTVLPAEVPSMKPNHTFHILDFIFYLVTVIDEHLSVVIRQEGSRIEDSQFWKLDSWVGQVWGMLLGHTGIKQSVFRLSRKRVSTLF